MDDVIARLREANARYCNNCQRQLYCYTPCALVQSYMMGLPCTPELERLSGYQEKEG